MKNRCQVLRSSPFLRQPDRPGLSSRPTGSRFCGSRRDLRFGTCRRRNCRWTSQVRQTVPEIGTFGGFPKPHKWLPEKRRSLRESWTRIVEPIADCRIVGREEKGFHPSRRAIASAKEDADFADFLSAVALATTEREKFSFGSGYVSFPMARQEARPTLLCLRHRSALPCCLRH